MVCRRTTRHARPGHRSTQGKGSGSEPQDKGSHHPITVSHQPETSNASLHIPIYLSMHGERVASHGHHAGRSPHACTEGIYRWKPRVTDRRAGDVSLPGRPASRAACMHALRDMGCVHFPELLQIFQIFHHIEITSKH